MKVRLELERLNDRIMPSTVALYVPHLPPPAAAIFGQASGDFTRTMLPTSYLCAGERIGLHGTGVIGPMGHPATVNGSITALIPSQFNQGATLEATGTITFSDANGSIVLSVSAPTHYRGGVPQIYSYSAVGTGAYAGYSASGTLTLVLNGTGNGNGLFSMEMS